LGFRSHERAKLAQTEHAIQTRRGISNCTIPARRSAVAGASANGSAECAETGACADGCTDNEAEVKVVAAAVSAAETIEIPVRLHPGQTARVPPIKEKLSLRELETFARAGLARFLALFHTRIATKKPVGFQRGAQVSVGLQKRA
jgi:hypothetical protein